MLVISILGCILRRKGSKRLVGNGESLMSKVLSC